MWNGFDFTHPDFKKNSLNRQRFYISNHDKPITLAQFTAEVQSWPRKELHNSQTRGGAACRDEYRRLVRNYGFFPGGQDGPTEA